MRRFFAVFLLGFTSVSISIAQSTNDVLNLLILNKTITQEQADSIRAEYSIKQQENLPNKKLKIDFEFRPKSEYRNGYQQLPNDTTTGAFSIQQRSRINLSFLHENKFAMLFSFQDLRIWGQQDPKYSTPSTLQVFEAWVEPFITPNLSVRIGRQRLVYDNQRLFSDNNWRVGGVSHDAMVIKYNHEKITSDLALAFNQSSELITGTDYKPANFSNYKFLAFNYSKFNLLPTFTLTAINVADGYQNLGNPEKLNLRYTHGGRIEFEKGSFYATISAYYQWGKDVSNTTDTILTSLYSWYVQPEVKYSFPFGLITRLGAEIFSGNAPEQKGHAFVPLYGSGHSFNGSLDLITKFPGDVDKAGLINPYLFIIKTFGKTFELRVDFHTFSLKEDYKKSNKLINKYLGFENDWLISWKPNSSVRLDFGYSYAVVTESFEIVKKAAPGAHTFMPNFYYLSLIYKPQIFATSLK